MQEDTNIYRTIVYPREANGRVGIKKWLQDRLGKMMAKLAEWGESRQQVVLFTETELIASESVLITPPLPPAPMEPATAGLAARAMDINDRIAPRRRILQCRRRLRVINASILSIIHTRMGMENERDRC
jgi:hypothetical protein